MPPKGAPRARGGARSARGGRGGAAAGQPSNSEAAPPIATGSAQSTEPTVVAKQEDGSDVNVPTALESVGAGSLSSSQTIADSAARPPRQRLDSLKSAEPSSRSASPAVRRGSSSRGKKPIALPSFSGRRSKEERDARTAEAAAREKERNKFRDREADRKQREREKAAERAKRSAAVGRGGYSGAVSGPFSMAGSREKKVNQRNFGSGGGAGSRATRVKDEYDGPGGSSSRSGGSYFKREGGGDGDEESSEDDQDAEFPRKDIDLIEISDDDNDDSAPVRTQLPVRIGRKEHKERVVGINTDASTEMSAKLLKEAEGAGNSSAEGQEGSSNKSNAKENDVEITGERRPFKGMWQDPEDTETKVKSEPTSDLEEMAMDAEQVGIGANTDDTQVVERKPKIKEKVEPALQTDEERAEWARFQANLRHVREELGPEEEITTQDSTGDVNMVDAPVADKPNRRDNHVYLFQLPPIIPELLESKAKKEGSDSHPHPPRPVEAAIPKHTGPSLSNTAGAPAATEGPQIKQEEGEFSSTLPKAPEAPKFASGRVGKLKVHQSGRTTLNWGGVDYELTPGHHVSFLQEVVSLRIEDEKNRVAEEMAGDAVSLGRIKGKFVVTPDFSTIFG